MAGTCCLCVAVLLHVAIVLAASLSEVVGGHCSNTISSQLSIHPLFPCKCLGCRGGRRPCRRLSRRAGDTRSLQAYSGTRPYIYPKANSNFEISPNRTSPLPSPSLFSLAVVRDLFVHVELSRNHDGRAARRAFVVCHECGCFARILGVAAEGRGSARDCHARLLEARSGGSSSV